MKRCLWAGMLGLLVGVAPTWAGFTPVVETSDREEWCSAEYTHVEILQRRFGGTWAEHGSRTDSNGKKIDYYDSSGTLYAIRMNDTDAGGDDDRVWAAGCYSGEETDACSLHADGHIGYDLDGESAAYPYVSLDTALHGTQEFELSVASCTFRWAIDVAYRGTYHWSDESTYDPMVTYYITENPNILALDPEERDQHWMIFWEEYAQDELTSTGLDQYGCPTWSAASDSIQDGDDYNDSVFEVFGGQTCPEFTHVGDVDTVGEYTHADVLEAQYSPGVAWTPYQYRLDDSCERVDYTNGWLYAIRVDDDSDLTWGGSDDHQYELRNVYRGSSTSSVQIGYDKNSGGFTSAFTVDFGGGFGEPGFATVGVADGDVLTWQVSAGSTLTSNSVSPNHMVTYVITTTPETNLALANADHWLCFWEEHVGTSDDHNDIVVDLRLAPEIPAEPVFYTWQTPKGAALSDSRVLELVNPSLHECTPDDLLTPTVNEQAEAAANETCDTILDLIGRGYNFDSDRVAIFLYGFPSGGDDKDMRFPRLARHGDDRVACTQHTVDAHPLYTWTGYGIENGLMVDDIAYTTPEQSDRTLWADSGIPACQAWMDDFISTYKSRQLLNSNIPDPIRFHFDTETYSMSTDDHSLIWDDIVADARFSNTILPGFASTLSQLYQAFLTNGGSPPSDTTEAWWYCSESIDNRPWGRWYVGLSRQAFEGAMDKAAYSRIRNGWPSCRSSNYDSSAHYDGADDRWNPSAYGHNHRWLGFADLQAPVLYAPPAGSWQSWLGAEVSSEDATLILARRNLRACLGSFGGCSPTDITPWIGLPNTLNPLTTRSSALRVLALIRSRGITEAIVYTNAAVDTPASWTMFDLLIDHVWGASLAATNPTTINEGIGRQTDATLLDYALNEYYVVESETLGTNNIAEFDVTFETDFDYSVQTLRVCLETTNLDYWGGWEDVTAYVSVYNVDTRSFDAIGNVTIPCADGAFEHQEIYFDLDGAADYFDVSGNVVVRVRYESDGAFMSMTDLVQLVGADEKTVIFVDGSATGAETGATWNDAYPDLQDALAEAAVNSEISEIWVAAGAYSPGALTSDSFELVDGIRIYGGFDGTETSLDERDVETNATILSGDLGGANSDHVVTIVNCSEDTLLDGFTITDGIAANSGGGIYMYASDAVIRHCTIVGNKAAQAAAGVFVTSGGAPAFDNCLIIGNEVLGTLGYPMAGGLRFSSDAAATITNCTIAANDGITSSGGVYGPATTVLTDCIIWGNSAQYYAQVYGVTVTYSDIEGGWTGTGNINSDPLFTDASNGDYTLTQYSPCIDVGDNNSVPAGCDTDLAGETRIVDGDGDTTETVDMGCYEYQPS